MTPGGRGGFLAEVSRPQQPWGGWAVEPSRAPLGALQGFAPRGCRSKLTAVHVGDGVELSRCSGSSAGGRAFRCPGQPPGCGRVPDPASLKGSCGEPGPGAAPCALQGWRLVWASLCSSVNEELPWGMRQARPAPHPARHTVDPTPVPETASQTVKGCAHEKL